MISRYGIIAGLLNRVQRFLAATPFKSNNQCYLDYPFKRNFSRGIH